MLSLFLLIVCFYDDKGLPSIDVEVFNDMKSCKANIESTTNFLAQSHIDMASITCSEHKIGSIS